MSLYSTMSSLLVSIVFLIVLNGLDFWLFLISEMSLCKLQISLQTIAEQLRALYFTRGINQDFSPHV